MAADTGAWRPRRVQALRLLAGHDTWLKCLWSGAGGALVRSGCHDAPSAQTCGGEGECAGASGPLGGNVWP